MITVSECSQAGAQQQSNRNVSSLVFHSLRFRPGGIAMATPGLCRRESFVFTVADGDGSTWAQEFLVIVSDRP